MCGFRCLLGFAAALLPLAAISSRPPETVPKHLEQARELVDNLDLADTTYVHGEPDLQWKGTNGATKNVVKTDCSGFIDALFTHSYGYSRDDFKAWLGQKRPTADHYHDTIAAQKGFMSIAKFKDVQPGDLLAIKYFKKKDNTGHIMLAAGVPRSMKPQKPEEPGTDQWSLKIIDCSKSGHGLDDTRHKKGPNGADHPGLGEGVVRIYTFSGGEHDGEIAGFSWSTLAVSQFAKPADEHMVVGRVKPNFKP